MRKLVLLAGIFSLLGPAKAQVKKGSWIIGGQASYYQVDYSPNTTYAKSSKNPSAVLSVGKAFGDNNVWGLSVGYLANSFTNTIYIGGYQQNGNMNTYSGNIFNRKYEKIVSGLYAFSELGDGFSVSRHDNEKAFSIFLYGTPGIAYRLRKKIFIELLLPNLVRLSYYNATEPTYSNSSSNYYQAYKTETTNIELSTNLSLASMATGIRIDL